MGEGFRKKVHLPLDNLQNVLTVMDYMIEGFDEVIYEDNQTEKVLA